MSGPHRVRSSAQARIDGRTFTLLEGEDVVKGWRHPDGGFEKFFCSECGAHLFSRNPDDPAQMSVRMSAFDGDPGVRPIGHAFADLRRGLGADPRRRPRALARAQAGLLAREITIAPGASTRPAGIDGSCASSFSTMSSLPRSTSQKTWRAAASCG